MATYVAFLRAINLGARRKFPKDAVMAATEAAGFDAVATHLNTGNVRLETAMRSTARIEEKLEAAYLADRDFEVPAIVFSPSELRAILDDAEKLAVGHAGMRYVSLLKREPEPEVVSVLEARSTDDERVVVRGRAAHLLVGENYHQSRLDNAVVERALGTATNRNVTVLRAVVQKWC